MEKLTPEAEKILLERFGKDSVLSLATSLYDQPYVRSVNAFYKDGSFYVLTYGLSNKMQQLAVNPKAALCGEWFSANGLGYNLGCFGKKENEAIARKMRSVFAQWIDNGHYNFADENTCILQIKLTDGILFSHGTHYDIDFT